MCRLCTTHAPPNTSLSREPRRPLLNSAAAALVSRPAPQVALDQGVDATLVSRAGELYRLLRSRKQDSAPLPAAALLVSPGTEHLLPEAGADTATGGGSLAAEGAASAGKPGEVAGANDTAAAAAAPVRTLEDAVDVLLRVVRGMYEGAPGSGGSSSGVGTGGEGMEGSMGGGGGGAPPPPAVVYVVHPGEQPAPVHNGCGVVYVIQWASGWFYVGQTIAVSERLAVRASGELPARRRAAGKGGLPGRGVDGGGCGLPAWQGCGRWG
eukprot:83623-Chlamydomonas_euryale.AAC.1